jgi:hypothetical protein
MFSSIVVPAFQRLAAMLVGKRNNEEHKRSCEKRQITHMPNSCVAQCHLLRHRAITRMSETATLVEKQ